MRHVPCIALLLGCAALSACSRDERVPPGARTATGEVLPAPAAVSGSVTGMPAPGQAQGVPAPMVDTAAIEAPAGVNEQATAGDPGTLPSPDAAAADAAVSALRQYYAALNARDYATAYAHWEDGGRASGQSLAGFAAGFEGTEGSSVQFGPPGPVLDDALGRTVSIPATIEARQRDGNIRRYMGSYTLRAGTMDDADPGSRSWRIAAASLAEVLQ